jgi:transcriptional regulator with XRE-family HTH domain
MGTAGPSALSAESLFSDRMHKPVTADNGDKPVLEEQPGHMVLARFIALGLSQKEAGEAAGYSQNHVSRLLKMPWFQARVAGYLEASASGDLMTLFRGAGLQAFATLVEIVDNPKTPAAVRLAGVKEILERNLGKSTQYLEVKSTGSGDPVAEAEALEREVGNLRSTLKLPGCEATDNASL